MVKLLEAEMHIETSPVFRALQFSSYLREAEADLPRGLLLHLFKHVGFPTFYYFVRKIVEGELGNVTGNVTGDETGKGESGNKTGKRELGMRLERKSLEMRLGRESPGMRLGRESLGMRLGRESLN